MDFYYRFVRYYYDLGRNINSEYTRLQMNNDIPGKRP